MKFNFLLESKNKESSPVPRDLYNTVKSGFGSTRSEHKQKFRNVSINAELLKKYFLKKSNSNDNSNNLLADLELLNKAIAKVTEVINDILKIPLTLPKNKNIITRSNGDDDRNFYLGLLSACIRNILSYTQSTDKLPQSDTILNILKDASLPNVLKLPSQRKNLYLQICLSIYKINDISETMLNQHVAKDNPLSENDIKKIKELFTKIKTNINNDILSTNPEPELKLEPQPKLEPESGSEKDFPKDTKGHIIIDKFDINDILTNYILSRYNLDKKQHAKEKNTPIVLSSTTEALQLTEEKRTAKLIISDIITNILLGNSVPNNVTNKKYCDYIKTINADNLITDIENYITYTPGFNSISSDELNNLQSTFDKLQTITFLSIDNSERNAYLNTIPKQYSNIFTNNNSSPDIDYLKDDSDNKIQKPQTYNYFLSYCGDTLNNLLSIMKLIDTKGAEIKYNKSNIENKVEKLISLSFSKNINDEDNFDAISKDTIINHRNDIFQHLLWQSKNWTWCLVFNKDCTQELLARSFVAEKSGSDDLEKLKEWILKETKPFGIQSVLLSNNGIIKLTSNYDITNAKVKMLDDNTLMEHFKQFIQLIPIVSIGGQLLAADLPTLNSNYINCVNKQDELKQSIKKLKDSISKAESDVIKNSLKHELDVVKKESEKAKKDVIAARQQIYNITGIGGKNLVFTFGKNGFSIKYIYTILLTLTLNNRWGEMKTYIDNLPKDENANGYLNKNRLNTLNDYIKTLTIPQNYEDILASIVEIIHKIRANENETVIHPSSDAEKYLTINTKEILALVLSDVYQLELDLIPSNGVSIIDLSEDSNLELSALKQIIKLCKENNIKIYIVDMSNNDYTATRKLKVVGSVEYNMIRMKSHDVKFAELSNFHPCTMNVDNITFNRLEAAYSYMKLKFVYSSLNTLLESGTLTENDVSPFFTDWQNIINQLLSSSSGDEARHLGHTYPESSYTTKLQKAIYSNNINPEVSKILHDWDTKYKVKTMWDLLNIKFTSNKDCLNQLKNTSGYYILNDVPNDDVWATLNYNYLGKMLCMLRLKLMHPDKCSGGITSPTDNFIAAGKSLSLDMPKDKFALTLKSIEDELNSKTESLKMKFKLAKH